MLNKLAFENVFFSRHTKLSILLGKLLDNYPSISPTPFCADGTMTLLPVDKGIEGKGKIYDLQTAK